VRLLALELREQEVVVPVRPPAHVAAETKAREPRDRLRPRTHLPAHLVLLLGRQLPRELEEHHVLDATTHGTTPHESMVACGHPAEHPDGP
jgi:hypothetical protein